jgi:hypothetical protein
MRNLTYSGKPIEFDGFKNTRPKPVEIDGFGGDQ